MAMSAGSVVVAGDGTTSTKTGLAGELYDAALAEESSQWPDPNSPPSGVQISASSWTATANAAILGFKRDIARDANAIAQAVVSHIQTNALVNLGTGAIT